MAQRTSKDIGRRAWAGTGVRALPAFLVTLVAAAGCVSVPPPGSAVGESPPSAAASPTVRPLPEPEPPPVHSVLARVPNAVNEATKQRKPRAVTPAPRPLVTAPRSPAA
ncbi:hypothetical protein QMK28_20540, partial [Streptomyces sp. H27-D2]|nr:hypothetical protein [Streptomyces sp. H27-D2]